MIGVRTGENCSTEAAVIYGFLIINFEVKITIETKDIKNNPSCGELKIDS